MGNLSSLRGASKNVRLIRSSGSGNRHYVHAGVDTASQFDYRDWKVRITSRYVGVAVRRRYFQAQLTGPCAPFRHQLARSVSQQQAVTDAKSYIDNWYQTNGQKWMEDKRRRARQDELRRLRLARERKVR